MFKRFKRCYFCGRPAVRKGEYYEVHYGGSGSYWRQILLCDACEEEARHCHYCTLRHAAYNCQDREAIHV